MIIEVVPDMTGDEEAIDGLLFGGTSRFVYSFANELGPLVHFETAANQIPRCSSLSYGVDEVKSTLMRSDEQDALGVIVFGANFCQEFIQSYPKGNQTDKRIAGKKHHEHPADRLDMHGVEEKNYADDACEGSFENSLKNLPYRDLAIEIGRASCRERV